MNYRNAIASRIKANLDIKEVMQAYGVEFNRRGFAICPFHEEKTASLSCKNGYYKCFGCGAAGDVIAFVQKYYNESFTDAVKRLNYDFHLGLGTDKPESCTEMLRKRQEQERKRQEREQFEALYTKMCSEYQRLHHAFIHDAPKIPNEPIKDSFAEACHKLPYLEYWFDRHPFYE